MTNQNQDRDLIELFGCEQLDHPPYTPDLLLKEINLFHGNARLYMANHTQYIGSFDWKQLDHPPRGPDLAPSD